MPINQYSAIALQSMIRRLLKLDAESSKQLEQFEGKTIHLSISDLKLDYFVSFSACEIFISEQSNDELSATICGTLPAFLAAAASEHSSDSIFKGELNFSGEVSTAKQFQTFAQSLDIDWQEPIAQIFGDPIGHTLAKGIQEFSSWFLSAIESGRRDISEYLQEEVRVTPSQSEQQGFFQQVDQLRSNTDRLTAKVQRLIENKTNDKAQPQSNHSL